MLELDTCYSFSQIPYISYDGLDDYAEKVIDEFMPELLTNPGILDVDAFIEFYCELTPIERRICYNGKVLGMTAFNDGMVEVINEKTGQPGEIFVERGTIITDPALRLKRNEKRGRFTIMHEGGGHWLIHRKAFADDNPFGPAGIYKNQYLAAKEGRGDYLRSTNERDDIQRMERQADFLSSAILMPRPALREAFKEYFSYFHEKPRRIVRGKCPMDDLFAAQLPEYVSHVFNVSAKTALIRLEKLTAIVDRRWGYFV